MKTGSIELVIGGYLVVCWRGLSARLKKPYENKIGAHPTLKNYFNSNEINLKY
jgi:hypothetical protein